MKVIVSGGRDFEDRPLLFRTLWTLHQERGPFTLLAHGAATGADALADEWAKVAGVPVKPYRAEGGKYGKGAGRRRNERMLYAVRPALVIAFPTGGPGTAHMVEIATAFGTEVIQITAGGNSQ